MVAGRIAVVGAGLAGLSAALELKKAGHEVDLFERSRLLGGKATSFTVDGIEVDNGQHVYLGCCGQFIDFVREVESHTGPSPSPLGVGLATPVGARLPTPWPPRQSSVSGTLFLQDRFDALLLARGKRPVRLRAVNLPAPFHLLPALLKFRMLSIADRLRLARGVLAARRRALASETFAGWLDRHGQSAASRSRFWEPFLVPALNAPLDQVSAEDALFVIRTAFLSDAGAARFGYSRVPLARIAEAAASRLDSVYLRSAVVGLHLENEGDRRISGIELEDGSHHPFDAVVLAVPPNRLERILGNPRRFGVIGLDQFRFAPIGDVHLWYENAHFGFDFAAVLGSPVQWIFEKGPGYLCCSMSAAEEFISMPNQELVEFCDRELRGVLPELAGAKLVRGSATRDREATFVPEVGLRRPGVETNVRNLAIAGAWTDTGWPATMESAVRSGRAAARSLVPVIKQSEVSVA